MNRLLASIGESSIGSWARQNHMVAKLFRELSVPSSGVLQTKCRRPYGQKEGKGHASEPWMDRSGSVSLANDQT